LAQQDLTKGVRISEPSCRFTQKP